MDKEKESEKKKGLRQYTVFYVSADGFFCSDNFWANDSVEAKQLCVRRHPYLRDITGVELGFTPACGLILKG